MQQLRLKVLLISLQTVCLPSLLSVAQDLRRGLPGMVCVQSPANKSLSCKQWAQTDARHLDLLLHHCRHKVFNHFF